MIGILSCLLYTQYIFNWHAFSTFYSVDPHLSAKYQVGIGPNTFMQDSFIAHKFGSYASDKTYII